MFLSSWFLALENFFFVPRCVFCKKEGSLFCAFHLKDIPRCSDSCLADGLLVSAVFPYHYKGVQKIVERFKYKGVWGLSWVMASYMTESFSFESSNSVFIPIPLHWSRQIWRGFNQSFLLARDLSFSTGIEVNTDLKRIRKSKQQARLSRLDRAKNVENIFTWKGDSLQGKVIYLVDDVCTSGLTLQSAARVLKRQGAKQVRAIVFARA